MLRTLIVGAAAAIIGTKLKKAYDAGKLDPYIDRAKAAMKEAQNSSATRSARQDARSSSADASKPARATPWPIDTRAIPTTD